MVEESKILNNAKHIQMDMDWLYSVLNHRIKAEFGEKKGNKSDIAAIINNPPAFGNHSSPYARFIEEHTISPIERLLLMLVMAPYVKPQILDIFLVKSKEHQGRISEFGGEEGKSHRGFIPSVQTFLFIASGSDLELRFNYLSLFESRAKLILGKYILLSAGKENEPFISYSIQPSQSIIDLFTKGSVDKPTYSKNFPAKLISTSLNWEDLVVSNQTENGLNEIHRWFQHNQVLMNDWGMNRILKPGMRVLFFGPPGTGKTLTAKLLGKMYQKDVYRIDISQLVSKFIGETEKNLARVLDEAETKDWILFFDEADALFGKRTNVESSNDRHANQEVAYLLQRIEDYKGLVVLASNLKKNIDAAFIRRFQSIIYFPIPAKKERLTLWENMLPAQLKISENLDLEHIADKYELSGGTICNIVHYCSLKALDENKIELKEADIREGLQKELMKSGRTM